MLLHTIADQRRQEIEHAPENFRFVDPADIEVRTKVPKWTWVARVAHELPENKCVLLPVPEGMNMYVFMNNLRSNLSTGHAITRLDKFSIRKSKCGKYVVLMKSGTWFKTYKDMESQGPYGCTPTN
jgi:hypothetical protein